MKSVMRFLTGFFAAWLFLAPCSAAAATVMLGAGEEALSLHGKMDFLDEPAASLKPEQAFIAAQRGQFKPLTGHLGRGYTRSVSWLKFDLINTDSNARRVLLRLSPQMLDYVDVYTRPVAPGSEAITHFPMGDSRPEAAATLPFMTVPLEMHPGDHIEVLIRIQTSSSHLLSAEVVPENRYFRDSFRELVWVIAYQAIALGLALVTFLQAYRIRDTVHALYGFVPLGLALNSYGTEGVGKLLMPATAHLLNNGLVGFSVMLSFGGLCLFFTRAFQTSRRHPRMHRYLQALILMSVLVFAASSTQWYGPVMTGLLALGMGLPVILLWVAMQSISRGGETEGRLFLFAFTIPLIGITVAFLRYLGVLPQNVFTQHAMSVSSLVHMFIMSLALTERLLKIESSLKEVYQRSRMELEHREDQEKLLSMMAHELMTPVAVIDASIQSLETLDAGAGPEHLARYERIRRALRRLTLLMEIAGRNVLQGMQTHPESLEQVSPARLTEEVLALLDEPQRQRIGLEAAADLPLPLADRSLLGFAWLNLVDNACKYSPAGSPVTIRIRSRMEGARPGIEWRIIDHGPGVPAGMEERVFERYQRGSEFNNVPGLGLGLYISRAIAALHHGNLAVCNEAQSGGCFAFWLPLTPGSAEPGA